MLAYICDLHLATSEGSSLSNIKTIIKFLGVDYYRSTLKQTTIRILSPETFQSLKYIFPDTTTFFIITTNLINICLPNL